MDQRLRVFIDFWSFQLNWNDRTGKAPPDWPKVPLALAQKARDLMALCQLARVCWASFEIDGLTTSLVRGT